MDYLQEGIGLRAMAQRDPLVEYQKEGFDMFSAMMDAIKEESVGFLFNLEVQVEDEASRTSDLLADDAPPAEADEPVPDVVAAAERVVADIAAGRRNSDDHPHISAKGLGRTESKAGLTYSAPSLDSEAPEVRTEGGAAPETGNRAAAAKQRRANPNRGSRGNKRKR
jgi:preprotein translocase subunit SecA